MPAPTPEERRRKELDHLDSLACEELRRLAASVRHSFPNTPLSPSTIVQEARMKLANSAMAGTEPELDFKYRAGKAMRQILVEAARRLGAEKRGGKALHDALEALARLNPRQIPNGRAPVFSQGSTWLRLQRF